MHETLSQFHIDRCLDIIEIVMNREVSIQDIATKHFSKSQLQGIGQNRTINEILAHLKLME